MNRHAAGANNTGLPRMSGVEKMDTVFNVLDMMPPEVRRALWSTVVQVNPVALARDMIAAYEQGLPESMAGPYGVMLINEAEASEMRAWAQERGSCHVDAGVSLQRYDGWRTPRRRRERRLSGRAARLIGWQEDVF